MDSQSIKSENPNLNDGLLEYGTIKTLRDDKTMKKIGEGFETIGSLFFGFQQINPRFDNFQVSSLSVVDVKVRCYYVKDFSKTHKVKIGHELYELENYDVDSKQKFMYLFLRKVGEWNGQTLVKTTQS